MVALTQKRMKKSTISAKNLCKGEGMVYSLPACCPGAFPLACAGLCAAAAAAAEGAGLPALAAGVVEGWGGTVSWLYQLAMSEAVGNGGAGEPAGCWLPD